jgi:glutathione S-transferase
MELTLVSHKLCPYVQRTAIVLLEKGVPFSRRWVDLAHKPDWFSAISPLGKTPVLLTGGEAIFESAVICEYLDDTFAPRLHPGDALQRARHRAWMEFGSSLLATIGAYYNAADAAALDQQRQVLRARLGQLEQAVHPGGPYFAGSGFCMVDAVFAPAFRYFDTFEALGEHGFFDLAPRVQHWRQALRERPSVQQAVVSDYEERLLVFLRTRGSELSKRVAAKEMA